MAAMAQLNVRMAPELKAAGDSVLSLYDLSPSEVVRSLWMTIAHGPEAISELAQLFRRYAEQDVTGGASSQGPTASVARHVQAIHERFAEDVGLDLLTYEPPTDEELDELVYQDWHERQLSEGMCHAT